MRWTKRGVVWKPDGGLAWARTHAMAPTPYRLDDEVIRVFVTCLDEKGRGRPGHVDVAAKDPTNVLRVGAEPLLDIGLPGSFDDNGLVLLSVVEPERGTLFGYYSGFEKCTQVPYRILTGLAVSRDGGATFERHSRVPILDRTDRELYFRCGAFAMLDEGVFRLWYVAGSEWTNVDGKTVPVYELRYLESLDGVLWAPEGTRSLPVTGGEEHGIGRPWVVRRGRHDYQLFYSSRRRSLGAYRLGYAESTDGIHWTRKDAELGLDVSPGGFESTAISYSAVISAAGRTYCFYNGNRFGEDGFAVAELVP